MLLLLSTCTSVIRYLDFGNKIDSKSTTKTITNNGNAAASGAESNFYDGSFYFDGTIGAYNATLIQMRWLLILKTF